MKSLIVLFVLLCCAHVSVARKALPITICEADLTSPVSYPAVMDMKQASAAMPQKYANRQQAVQETSQTPFIGVVVAALCLFVIVGAGAYVRHKRT